MRMKVKSGMTRGRLVFICVWLGIFAVSFLIWAAVLGGITRDLAVYEQYQPIYAAEDAFRDLFADADAATISKYGAPSVSEYDADDAIKKRIEELLSAGELALCPAGDRSDTPCYEVTAGGEILAGFSLVEDETSRRIFGRRGFTVGEVYLLIEPTKEARIIAPKNAVVKINGKLVGEDLRLGDYIQLESADYFPEGDGDARLMAVYYVGGLFSDPEVTVTSMDGSIRYGIELDRANSVYDTEFSYRTALSGAASGSGNDEKLPDTPPHTPNAGDIESDMPYSDFLYEAITIYVKYLHQSNETIKQAAWRALSFFKPQTDIYLSILGYQNDTDYYPNTFAFTEVSIEELTWLDASKQTFKCIYGFKAEMSIGGKEQKVKAYRFEVAVDASDERPLITSLVDLNAG